MKHDAPLSLNHNSRFRVKSDNPGNAANRAASVITEYVGSRGVDQFCTFRYPIIPR